MEDIKNYSKNLKEILDYKPDGNLVISVYLRVDSSKVQRQDYVTSLNSMITETKGNIESNIDIDKVQKKNLSDLLEKIKRYVNDIFRTESTKTVIIYADSSGLWKVIRLPLNLKSKIIIDPKPHTQNLRTLMKNYKVYGVLLLDKEKAQIYSLYMGEVNEYLAALISEVPPKVNYRRQLAYKEKNLLSRIEEKLHQFFKIINERTFELFKDRKFDNLILAGRKEIIPQFENYLHSYLQQIHIGNIYAEPDSPISEIKEKSNKVIAQHETALKNMIINKLIDEYFPAGTGALGIETTIDSLILDQAKTIIYDINFKHDGYVCSSCTYLTVKKEETCPYCDSKLTYYSDIVDEIIEDALKQGCEVIDTDNNERLLKAGSIGAVLRYKL
jgi:peptide subunit release factor 1 (eRF1)